MERNLFRDAARLEGIRGERLVAHLEQRQQAVRHLGLRRLELGQRRLVDLRLQALHLPALEVVVERLAARAADARLDWTVDNEVHHLRQ